MLYVCEGDDTIVIVQRQVELGEMLNARLEELFNEAQQRLVVQTADLPLGTLAGMVESGAIDLQPGFQRRERWSSEKQSALIESFLLNVPVPPIYLSEEKDGKYTAIDGKQRLKAISDFMSNRYSLRSLDRLNVAEKLFFRDMPAPIVNALSLRPYLRVVTLLKQTDPLLKYEVFLRLNKGGESLNQQEIRNVAFRGRLNDKIYDLAGSGFLKKQLKIDGAKSSAYQKMADAEFVLRFFTLRERWEEFGGSLAQGMDDFMRVHQDASQAEVGQLANLFTQALNRCEMLWGANAFRRPEGQGWRDQTLAGMYDAQMIAVSLLSDAQINSAHANINILRNRTRDLFDDPIFDESVRVGTNTPNRIKYRVETMKEAVETL